MTQEYRSNDPTEPAAAGSTGSQRIRIAVTNPDDGTSTMREDDAWSSNDAAETVHLDLAAFSLTREQVAERYKAAGFDIQPRTVSDYGKRGLLRAHKVPAKNGLMRYLFDPTSIEEDIERRKRETEAHEHPSTVHAPLPHRRASASEDSNQNLEGGDSAWIDRRLYEGDLKVARLETELQAERRERQRAEQRAEREAERALALSHRVGQVQQQIADYQVKLAALEAPKAEETPDDAPASASFMHRLFRLRRKPS